MNIKKALKEKNKLVKEANEYYNLFSAYNSVEEGSNRPYDAKSMFQSWSETTEKLIDLKTRIHKANAPVYDKIFRLSELKSMVSKLKSVNCTEGKITNRGWRGESSDPVIMVSEMGIVERDEKVKGLEIEIEKIQDELDAHNATTEI